MGGLAVSQSLPACLSAERVRRKRGGAQPPDWACFGLWAWHFNSRSTSPQMRWGGRKKRARVPAFSLLPNLRRLSVGLRTKTRRSRGLFFSPPPRAVLTLQTGRAEQAARMGQTAALASFEPVCRLSPAPPPPLRENAVPPMPQISLFVSGVSSFEFFQFHLFTFVVGCGGCGGGRGISTSRKDSGHLR